MNDLGPYLDQLSKLHDTGILSTVNQQLDLWENAAKGELAILGYDSNYKSDEGNNILTGYFPRLGEKKQAKTRVKALYQVLQNISVARSGINNKSYIPAILCVIQAASYLLGQDAAPRIKARLYGFNGAASRPQSKAHDIQWYNEDLELQKTSPRLNQGRRAKIIARNYPKKTGSFLTVSAIIKGIERGRKLVSDKEPSGTDLVVPFDSEICSPTV